MKSRRVTLEAPLEGGLQGCFEGRRGGGERGLEEEGSGGEGNEGEAFKGKGNP